MLNNLVTSLDVMSCSLTHLINWLNSTDAIRHNHRWWVDVTLCRTQKESDGDERVRWGHLTACPGSNVTASEDLQKTIMPPSSLGDKNESFRWCKKDELHVFSETGESAQVTFDLSCDRKDTTQICRAKVQSTTKDNWKTWNRKNLNFLFSLFLIVTPICWTTYRKWIKMFTMCFA